MEPVIKINTADNVAVCLQPLTRGTRLASELATFTTRQDIPAGHKVLLHDAPAGTIIRKYGFPIGHLLQDLKAGDWVNEHSLATNLSGKQAYTYTPSAPFFPFENQHRTFLGYLRKNGEVGIRNEIWIIPTVGCVNGIAERLANTLREETNCQHIDAVRAWKHNYGCSQLGDDHEYTRTILRDLCLHPNAGAVLVLSLGCENNQPDAFMDTLGDYDKNRIQLLVTQHIKGDEFEQGMKILRQLYAMARTDHRTPQSLSKLRVGLKCGGSDGFSGISANPLVGNFSDYLVCQGGSTVLTEVPEMFGAETILMNRCKDESTFRKTVTLINRFKDYYLFHGQSIGENPSPGNKAGGISTLEEKALGCIQKCGVTPVIDVLDYGQRLSVSGLNLLSSPGNDLIASTALAAAGCQIVLFTTGRGTPFGTFVPTMKIASNTELSLQKPHWIDFNAGSLLEGTSRQALLDQLIEAVLSTASGQPTRNEENGYSEMAIFKDGVTL